MKGLLQREYLHERSVYSVDKRIANLISDMGFAIADHETEGNEGGKFHRLVKRTDQHMIVVTYELRERLVCPQKPGDDPAALMKQLQPSTFVSFLNKHGVMPPNTVGNEYDEDEQIRADLEARKHPLADEYDHADDATHFAISVVNRRNRALAVDCRVRDGEVTFDKVRLHTEGGIADAQQTWLDRARNPAARNKYPGPLFRAMSEPLQTELVGYLYSVGVRPEIGVAVEYLSWNKEQRLYMDWLKRMYVCLFAEELREGTFLSPGDEKLKDPSENEMHPKHLN